MLIAIGIDEDGRRCVPGVEIANRESHTSWKEYLLGLRGHGLAGAEFVVSDHHDGLHKSIRGVLPEAAWQRCDVHFLCNALDHLPTKANHDRLPELRRLCDRRDLKEAQQDLSVWLSKLQSRYGKLCDWVEATR